MPHYVIARDYRAPPKNTTLGTGEHCCLDAGRLCVFIHQAAALFCGKWLYGRHLEIMTSRQKSRPVSRWVFARRTILQNFILVLYVLKRRSLGLLLKVRHNNNKMSSDMRYVQYSSRIECWMTDHPRCAIVELDVVCWQVISQHITKVEWCYTEGYRVQHLVCQTFRQWS